MAPAPARISGSGALLPAPAAQLPPDSRPASGTAARASRFAALLVAVVAVLGLYIMSLVTALGLDVPLRGSLNIFFRLFAMHELPALAVLLLFAVAAYVLTGRRGAHADDVVVPGASLWASRGAAWAIAGVVLAATWAGTFLVMHAFPFSMDEYGATFQARIFAGGRTSAPVPEQWRGWVPAMLPVFTTYRAADGTWLSLYLPAYAALKAAFLAVRLESLLNPLLAATSVVAIAGIARRLWPEAPARATLAAVLLATSAQFLVTATSGYSMPAHLCLNLAWLWLYLRDDRPAIAIAPVIGVIALGLHNPFPHALFVAPFLLRRLRERRWGTIAWMGGVYLAGSAWWLLQLRALREGVDASGLSGAFAAPDMLTLYTQGISLASLIGWQTPVLAIAAAAAMLSWSRLSAPLRDLALGLLGTLAFYCFFPSNQGHGWGYRYAHGVLGNLALLGVAGFAILGDAMGRARFARLAFASLAVTLLFQVPLRAVQVERFVGPFAEASRWIASLPDEVVLVPTNSVWYGRDLVRNDPWLAEGPKIMAAAALRPGAHAELLRLYPGRVRTLMPADLTRFGLRIVQRGR
jgi:hypothetical protein